MIQTWLAIPIALLLYAPGYGDEASSSPEKENRNNQLIGAGPFEVEAFRDISYVPSTNEEQPNRKQMLDVYTPKGQTDFPVLFFVHGGGWASGDRKLYIALGNVFARNGIGTVVISYRLSPEVQHPGHIQDVASAFAWTRENIAEYGGDPEQIFVAGQSAGGHLTALLATNAKYLGDVDQKPSSIRGAIPISGIYQFRPGQLKRIIGDGKAAARDASPLEHINGEEPPFMILYAESDLPGCGRMSARMRDDLKAKGVEAEVQKIDKRNHVSIMLRLMLNEGDPTTQAMLRFMEKHSTLELEPLGEDR